MGFLRRIAASRDPARLNAIEPPGAVALVDHKRPAAAGHSGQEARCADRLAESEDQWVGHIVLRHGCLPRQVARSAGDRRAVRGRPAGRYLAQRSLAMPESYHNPASQGVYGIGDSSSNDDLLELDSEG